MRMALFPVLLVIVLLGSALSGCLAKAKTVRLPDGRTAVRIECNYDKTNCRRKASERCAHGYDVVGDGTLSCLDCGMKWRTPLEDPPHSEVFKGTLYVRCRKLAP